MKGTSNTRVLILEFAYNWVLLKFGHVCILWFLCKSIGKIRLSLKGMLNPCRASKEIKETNFEYWLDTWSSHTYLTSKKENSEAQIDIWKEQFWASRHTANLGWSSTWENLVHQLVNFLTKCWISARHLNDIKLSTCNGIERGYIQSWLLTWMG